MTDPVYIYDHVDRAKANLTSDYSDAVKVRGLVAAFVSEIQEVEQVMYELIVSRYIGNASDAQLDQYGAAVGEPRAGLTNAEYRKFILARILTNLGEGEIPRLLEVVKTITSASRVKYTAAHPAHFLVEYVRGGYTSAAFRNRVKSQVLELTPAGVGFTVIEANEGYFGFNDDPDAFGFDVGEWAEEI
jgi:hypothetical protein